jgi:hypothetical protein
MSAALEKRAWVDRVAAKSYSAIAGKSKESKKGRGGLPREKGKNGLAK